MLSRAEERGGEGPEGVFEMCARSRVVSIGWVLWRKQKTAITVLTTIVVRTRRLVEFAESVRLASDGALWGFNVKRSGL